MIWAAMGLCLLSCSVAASEQQTLEAMRQRLAAIQSVRDQLVRRLEDRIAEDALKGENADYFLRFHEGADEEEMNVVLRRRGGKWLAACAAVPFWRQESFQDKFRYIHRGGNGYVSRDKWRFAVDARALEVRGRQLKGAAVIDVRIDSTREERFPPGTPVRWANTGEVFTWVEKMNALSHHTVRRQRYAVGADVSETVHEFALTLDNAVDGRCPLEVVFRAPASPWLSPEVRATWWNCGRHSADASGVLVTDGRLSGTLKVTLRPDNWFPKKPVEVTYVLNGTIDGPRCFGTYEATGGFGDLADSFQGECGQFITGRYEADGPLGRYASQIHGRKMPVRSKMQPLLTAGGQQPKTFADLAASINRTYHDIRALDMAIKQYPLPIEAALRQVGRASPQWGRDGRPIQDEQEDMLTHADQALRFARAALADAAGMSCLHGLSCPEDATFGPFYNSVPLKANGEGTCELPVVEVSGPQQWGYVPAWRVLGPLSHLDDYDRDFSRIPKAMPSKGRYAVDKVNFPRKKQPKGQAVATWQVVAAGGAKLVSPWQDIRRRGAFRGHSLMAAATLNAPKAMDVWLAMAAVEHAKLWINERLVWISDERQWRNHTGREAVFRAKLRKGANQVLVRCREDRGEAWFRMHVCLRGSPAASPIKPTADGAKLVGNPLGDGDVHFPDVDPPLAWDLATGQNVAWSAKVPEPIAAGPVAAGDRLFLCTHPTGIVCLDQKTGKVLWHSNDIALEAFARDERESLEQQIDAVRKSNKEKGRRGPVSIGGGWRTVFSDGRQIWAHHDIGATVCLDATGRKKWAVRTGLTKAGMLVSGGKVLLEGATARRKGQRGALGRRLALDGQTGKLLWQKEVEAAAPGGALHQLRLTGHRHESVGHMVASTSGQVFDARSGEVMLSRLDIDAAPPGARVGFAWHFVGNDLYCAKLSTIYAVRFFMDPNGQVGHRVLWRNNYGIKYDRPIRISAWGPWAMAINTVQEHCPGHSNAAKREVYVYDRLTGSPVVRIKPALDRAQADYTPSPTAGPYLFVHDSGGGASGGLPDAGQIGVVALDVDRPHVLCRSLIPLGAGPPAFDGNRMFLSHGTRVWCVSASTPAGRKYEQKRIATTLLNEIMPAPGKKAELAAPKPRKQLPAFDGAPCDPLEDRQGTEHWLLAGPFPPPEAAGDPAVGEKLASLRPRLGTKLEIGGVTKAFKALPRDAMEVADSWGHSYYLCGLGGTTTNPYRRIDMLRCTEGIPDRCGVLYTLIDNSRDREVAVDIPRNGLDVWLGGLEVRAGQRLHLARGVYPLLVRVRPECFERPLPPLDIVKALEKGTASALHWPKRWLVGGAAPESVDLAPLDQLKHIPSEFTVGGRSYKLTPRDADENGWLDLSDMAAKRDGKFVTKQTAYCFAPIDCDKGGTLVVNCSADWWMLWYLDGKLVYSTGEEGNGTNPRKLNAHTWSAAVSKGRHVLAAVVRSGSQGWSVMSLGAMIYKPIDELRREQIDPKAPAPAPKVTPVSFSLHPMPAAVLAARLSAARVRRKALERVVEHLPGTPEALGAAKWLKLLERASQE